MDPITVLENASVSMLYYPTKGLLHHQFHKHIWGEAFRDVLNKGVEVFTRLRGNKWLSDDRKNCALSKEDTDWAMQDWFPRVHKAGWKYWAVVLPNHVVGQMNMKRFVDTYSTRGIVAMVFDDPTDAMKWLEHLN
jgi:hypothetical protein